LSAIFIVRTSRRRLEPAIIERHRKRIADLEAHTSVQPDDVGDVFCDRADLWGQVDPGDSTAETRRKPAGRSAEPTANIEQVIGGPHRNERSHVLRRIGPRP
jgi:hypothetical protein